jgi:Mn2+/Fe2+ NRAMP family transporter
MHKDNAPQLDPDETLQPTKGQSGAAPKERLKVTVWRRLGMALLAGSCGGLVAGLAVLLLFRGLYTISFALADTIDGWEAFVVFGVAVIFSIILSGFLAGLAGAVVSGLLLRRFWSLSRRRLLLWAAMWLAGSTGLSLTVLGRGADPAVGMVAGGWWLLLGILLALLFSLPALLQKRSSA